MTRACKFLSLICLFAVLVWMAVPSAVAQTRSSAVATIRVLDASGAAVPGAEVTLLNTATNRSLSTTTNSVGQADFSGLPLTGLYEVSVNKAGFEKTSKSGMQLKAGDRAYIDIKLAAAGPASTVNVIGTAGSIEVDSAELSTRLDHQKIDETPILGRKATSLPLLNSAVRSARGTGDLFIGSTLFVINGAGRRQTTFSVDNTTGDDSWGRQTLFTTLPLTAIEEFTTLTNAQSAEYGRTTGGAVNIVTKTGTNAYHGELIGLWRPSSIGAKAPLSVYPAGDALKQGSGTVSGPIFRDKTYFSLSGEYTDQKRDAVITSPLSFGSVYKGEIDQSLWLARVDHYFSDRNRLTIRLNTDSLRDTNPQDAVAALTLPSAARVFERGTYAAQISETATLSDRMLNEARFQFQLGSPITRFTPVSLSTQFTRSGFATEGDSRTANLMNHQYQFGDTLSWIKGKHSFRFGVDAIYSSSGGFGQEFGGGYVLGQFTVNPASPNFNKPLSQLTIADMSKYQQSFGNLNYNVKETIWAGFIQDNFNVTPNLTLNLGVRYENQSLTDDNNNVAPRVGFAYRLFPSSANATVLRGSYGMFYSEVRSNLFAGYNISGPNGILTFSAAPGQLGFPTSLNPLPAFPVGAVVPARDININIGQRAYYSQFFDVSKLRFYPDKLLNPYTQQWTFGLEHQFSPTVTLSLDYVGQRTLKIERPMDLNAPAPFIRTAAGQVRSATAADATRPIVPVPNGYKRIITNVNQGEAEYNGLQAQLNKRFSKHLSGLVSYTWSHTIGTVEFDVPSQDPNDSNFLGALEKASSLLDQRHRMSISGWYELPFGFNVGTWFTFGSGRPYNITTGVDNNGDGSTADRPFVNGRILPRNAGQGTATYDLSMFAEKTFSLTERWKLSLRGEASNLTNHLNVVGRNGTYGNAASGIPNATLGTPLSGVANVDPARQFQFQARVRF